MICSGDMTDGVFGCEESLYAPEDFEDWDDLPFERVAGSRVIRIGKDELMAKKKKAKAAKEKYAAKTAARVRGAKKKKKTSATAKKKKKKKVRFRTKITGKLGKSKDVYDRLRQRRETRMRGAGGGFMRLQKGNNIVRPVPFEHDGYEELFVEQARHWGVDDGEHGNVLCPGEESCPICALLDTDELSEDLSDKLQPARKYIFNGIGREWPENEDEDAAGVFEVPVSVVEGRDDDVGLEEYILERVPHALDPKRGMDFRITKKGSGWKTRYPVTPMPKPSALGMAVNPKDLVEMTERNTKSEEELAELAEHIKTL